jgi:hypothetical protein
VLHRCDNPACVRVSHLFLGTHQDNEDDKCRKNRQSKGEGHRNAKLIQIDVDLIRGLYSTGEFQQKELAGMFRVGQNQISRIVRHEEWA